MKKIEIYTAKMKFNIKISFYIFTLQSFEEKQNMIFYSGCEDSYFQNYIAEVGSNFKTFSNFKYTSLMVSIYLQSIYLQFLLK